MKQLNLLIFCLLLNAAAFAQVAGNINYQNQVRYSENNINAATPSSPDVLFSVKGMANVKADTYVAIFNVTQVGKTTEEVNLLMDERLKQALKNVGNKPSVTTFVDMISFVPVYEFETQKKVFSKNSYNEIPKGFELKKNVHIRYTDPNLLNEIIAGLSKYEIYDLVRVDYFSNQIEAIKKELMAKASTLLQEKLQRYETLLATDLDSLPKHVTDVYRMVLPVERYKSYQAYNSSSLNLKKEANVNQADKSVTLYYQPIIDKEFDFVLNPTILEPVIQVMYEVKLMVKREVQNVGEKVEKSYILVTPNGDLKELKLNN